MSREYHVSLKGSDKGNGTIEQPFLTISKAATVAKAGDKVIVHEGVYREWVKPANSGKNNTCRITYKAAQGEKVIIKGSEQIENWENIEGTVWKAIIDNKIFGDYNPYVEIIEGDWLACPHNPPIHTGDVYLNGKSFYEAKSLEEVKNPVIRETGETPPWVKNKEYLLNPEDSIYQWYSETNDENTIIYANFHEVDPNKELVEINVRKCCFYPEVTGINYITVRGFEMAQAATPWTPPTADQPGLIGANWSKGWIIENNIIHDSKCSGISIGKERSTGHNEFTRHSIKPGYQNQLEVVYKALQIGWSKETIGSHIIRNNTIYDCGQNGVVGHLGCAFSKIYGNHIYNIGIKHEFFGYEIAGIKLHAPIDVEISQNNIHNCTLGTWLDWQAQGSRISRNLYYANDRDLMIEVTHGPYLVDNNILASDYNFDNLAQGGAYVNNLCCGTMRREPVLNRATPFHFPHTTQAAGFALVYGGDDRLYQNIFLGGTELQTDQSFNGTFGYDDCCRSIEEYIEEVKAVGPGDIEAYEKVMQPAYINKNVYLKGAKPYDKEETNYKSDTDPNVKIIQENNEVWLEINIEKDMLDLSTEILNTEKLGMVRIVEQAFETPEGNELSLDEDYFGDSRKENSPAGPIVKLKEGHNRIKVW